MEYILVRWIHDLPDEPVWLYSEVDDERWEARKVYLFEDGRVGWADEKREVGGVFLGTEQIPPLDELVRESASGAREEFEFHSITKEEFERVWQRATSETLGEP